jgi:peptidoglycan/LPS O-acetylase OafA/YrhL
MADSLEYGPRPKASAAPARLGTLDGLRGLAACGVAFLYHPLLEMSDVVARAPVPVVWLRDWGWTFVDLFFLISGYIFAHVYLRGPGAQGGLTRASLGDFGVARLARLYPLHLLMLLVSAFLFGAAPENTWTAFVAHLAMAQVFVAPVGHTFNGPSWSISVEVVCYVVFALGAVRGDKVLRWVTAGAIVVGLAQIVAIGNPGGPSVGGCLPRGLLGFFLGQVLWRRRADLARVPTPVLVALVALGLCVGTERLSPLLPIDLLAWPAALCLALRTPAMGGRALLWLGDRSYAVYLVHYPVLLYFMNQFHEARSGWYAVALLAAFTTIVLLLADLAHRRVEVPARRAIRAAWGRRARAGAPIRAAA